MKKLLTVTAVMGLVSLLLTGGSLAQMGAQPDKGGGTPQVTQPAPAPSAQPSLQEPKAPPGAEPGKGAEATKEEPKAQPGVKGGKAAETATGKELPASTLMSTTVRSREGESLGKINELVIDPKEGKITTAVLSFGGFLGIGGKSVAIPWSDVKLADNGKTITVAMAREQLETAPEWKKPVEETKPPMREPGMREPAGRPGLPQPERPMPQPR
jgi:sporulation protein YlmC with PRC-barrel domain